MAFYNSPVPALAAFLPGVPLIITAEKRRKQRLRKRRMRRDFLQTLRVFGDELRSGYSADNAVIRSLPELSELLGESSEILGEWQRMGRQLQNGRTVEDVFLELGRKTDIEEICSFSELLSIVTRSGGALHIIVDTAYHRMSAMESVRSEVLTKLSAKVLEQRIMDFTPLAILLYVRFFSPSLVAPLYQGLRGRMIMSIALLLYFFAFLWSEYILKVRETEV